MEKSNAQTHPLPWWAAGILLGLVQILAVSLGQSLDVSPQFINTNTKILNSVAPEYLEEHPIMDNVEYEESGHGWWFGIGIAIGAVIAAIYLKIWKLQITTDLWQQNHNIPIIIRMIICFFGGFLMLLGAGIAYGGISGHFFSGWAKLSLSAVAFIMLCATSCNDGTRPPEVLDASTFAFITGELLRTATDRDSDTPPSADSLLQTTGITRSAYATSARWYSSNPVRWNEVMRLVVTTLDSTSRLAGNPTSLPAAP